MGGSEYESDYYRLKGAPPSEGPVYPAEKTDFSPVLSDDEELNDMKCYRLDEETEIMEDRVYINGEGMPAHSKIDLMNAAVKEVDLDSNPGINPGNIETIVSYILAALVCLVIISTILYYILMVYRQPNGTFLAFVKKFAIKWPVHWWFCPPEK